MAARRVFRIPTGDTNLGSLVELFGHDFPRTVHGAALSPRGAQGDKRIILVDGEIAGAINRVPARRRDPVQPACRRQCRAGHAYRARTEICARLGPELKKRGLIFVGIDVIGDYLTEINVTSPTGIGRSTQFGGTDIAAMIWDVIEAKVARERKR